MRFTLFLTFFTIFICIHLSWEQDQFKVSYIHDQIKKGKKCSELIDYFLRRCYKYNSNLNAIISYNPLARAEAAKLDDYFTNKSQLVGKLHCIPVIIKDNIDINGMPSTAGIKALRYSIPNKDALIVQRLKNEGAIIIAKSNLAELAHGNETSETGGQCHNPFNYKKSCGASSTGSGASISSGLAIISVGTDTDGSITIPGAFNGIYGLRTRSQQPSIDGILPLFERQDTVGPFAKYINDLVLAYSIMSDNSTIYSEFSRRDNEKSSDLRVSVFNVFFDSFPPINYYLDSNVKSIMSDTLSRMKSIQLNITSFDLTQDELTNASQIILTQQSGAKACLIGCTRQAYNSYFNNSNRFQYDAPYKSFDDLFKSPLLSLYWRDELNKSVNSNNVDLECTQKCSLYDEYKAKYIKLIDSWFQRYNADALVIPNSAVLPYDCGSEQKNLTTFLIMATLANKLSFNVPVGYSSSTSESPDGLPVGLLLVSRDDRIVQAFKIARLIEESRSSAKLPSSTPIISDSNSSSKIFSMFNLIICSLILTKIF